MALVFRDSLSGQSLPLAVPPDRPLAMYVCGPTVYDRTHVGHARTYLYFDLLRRYFRERKIPVRHVMNITDFEDKITERAQELGMGWRALARREETGFFADLRRLGVIRPHVAPRASHFVPDMIRFTQALERTGRTTREGDEIYFEGEPAFDARNFPEGAEFARHAVIEPGRPPPSEDPSARRFLVWRRQGPPAPSWPSPWGRGSPGWHLECYSMVQRYFGVPVDLHGGGLDLVFPHHYAENVVAFTLDGSPFSRRFLHTGFVTQSGAKMSKSLGNLVSLREALRRYGAPALRWYLLRPRYNTRLEWSDRDAQRAREEFTELRRRVRGSLANGAGGTVSLQELRDRDQRVLASIEDGFAVDRALAELREWGDRLSSAARARFARGDRRAARTIYARWGALFGLPLT
jgi:cysteinyl-tRNA synthetase